MADSERRGKLRSDDAEVFLVDPSVEHTEVCTAAGSGVDNSSLRHGRASDTDPVHETGRLAGCFDAEEFVSRGLELQHVPKARCAVGDRAAVVFEERYVLSVTPLRLVALFERAASGR